MMKRVPDIGRIQELIGYDPKFSLEDIILDVADYQIYKRVNKKKASLTQEIHV